MKGTYVSMHLHMCNILNFLILFFLNTMFRLKIKPKLIEYAGLNSKISDIFAFA